MSKELTKSRHVEAEVRMRKNITHHISCVFFYHCWNHLCKTQNQRVVRQTALETTHSDLTPPVCQTKSHSSGGDDLRTLPAL